jgi:hypothetical protein
MVIGPFIPQKKWLTSVGLANMLQQKAFATASIHDFPQNCGKPWDYRAKVTAKPRFFRALSLFEPRLRQSALAALNLIAVWAQPSFSRCCLWARSSCARAHGFTRDEAGAIGSGANAKQNSFGCDRL